MFGVLATTGLGCRLAAEGFGWYTCRVHRPPAMTPRRFDREAVVVCQRVAYGTLPAFVVVASEEREHLPQGGVYVADAQFADR